MASTNNDEVLLYFDGGIRSSNLAFGFHASSPSKPDRTLFGNSGLCGTGTSNIAEYRALIAGLEECVRQEVRIVHIHGDSQLVVSHVLGIWKVRNPDLATHLSRVKTILEQFDSWTIKWIPRELNRVADAMVNEAFERRGVH